MKAQRVFSLLTPASILWTVRLLVLLAIATIFVSQSAVAQQPVVPKLTLTQIEGLVTNHVPDSTLQTQIQRRGLAFAPTPAIVESLRAKGAGPLTLAAISGAGTSKNVGNGEQTSGNESQVSGGWRQASDLQHCVHLILQVEVKEAVAAETDNTTTRLQLDLKASNISFSQVFKPDWSSRPELVEVDGVAPNNLSSVRAVLNQKYAKEYDINSTGQGSFRLTMKPLVEKALDEKTLQHAIATIRDRMNTFGIRYLLIQEYNSGANQILVELSDISDHVRLIIQSWGRLAIHAVKGDPSGYPDGRSALAAIGGVLPPDEEIVSGSGTFFILQRVAIVAGSDFRSAEPGVNQTTGHPLIHFMLTNDAGSRFYDFTSTNIGKSMAVVMDNRVREVAVIKSAIRDSGQIEGAFTQEEVMDLSKLLRAGELPVSLDFLETRTGCPSSSVLGPAR